MAGTRAKRVFASMSKMEAKKFGIAEGAHRRFFRIADDRVNMALPASRDTDWFEMKSVSLPNGEGDTDLEKLANGESIGVATLRVLDIESVTGGSENEAKILEAISAGEWRESPKANAWVGNVVADVLDLDVKEGRPTIDAVLKSLRQRRLIKTVQKTDKNKNKVAYVIAVKQDDDASGVFN